MIEVLEEKETIEKKETKRRLKPGDPYYYLEVDSPIGIGAAIKINTFLYVNEDREEKTDPILTGKNFKLWKIKDPNTKDITYYLEGKYNIDKSIYLNFSSHLYVNKNKTLDKHPIIKGDNCAIWKKRKKKETIQEEVI